MSQKIIAYLSANMTTYLQAVQTHLMISIQALWIAVMIGIPLGIFCSRNEKFSKYVTGWFNSLRIIPSLAILVLMIPLMGTGKTPALVALTILAVPPILINTIAGFAGIEASLYETAKGMGMDEKQIFLKIEWPLALPLMLTGVRTSAVEVSASATIAAYIGAGGLGNIVFTGLGLNKAELLLIGGVSVAAISIGAELILGTVQNAVTKYQRD